LVATVVCSDDPRSERLEALAAFIVHAVIDRNGEQANDARRATRLVGVSIARKKRDHGHDTEHAATGMPHAADELNAFVGLLESNIKGHKEISAFRFQPGRQDDLVGTASFMRGIWV